MLFVACLKRVPSCLMKSDQWFSRCLWRDRFPAGCALRSCAGGNVRGRVTRNPLLPFHSACGIRSGEAR